jgi:hypothetical protein
MESIAVDDNNATGLVWMAVGAAIIFSSLFAPFLYVYYTPPGGSAVVDGKVFTSFKETITGGQFASVASFTHISLALYALVALGVLRLATFLVRPDSEAAPAILKLLHAIYHVAIAFGWLILLSLAVIENQVVMPADGEKGILATFRRNPFAHAASIPGIPTPYLHASLGLSFFGLLLGLVVAAVGIWKYVAGAAILLLIGLPILDAISHGAFESVTGFLGF